jgi:hypothetical protein
MSDSTNSLHNGTTDDGICPRCGMKNGLHIYGCPVISYPRTPKTADQPHCVCLVCGCSLFFIRTDGVRCSCCGQLIEIPVQEILAMPESLATPEIDADILPFKS